MSSTFNPQILMEKLAKLNSSQQSIETLSHWCIFHMNKAKNVVETWDRQFHSSPREQRLAFLYLANDILQNSRRKGSEFVGEFWKVLPNALRDVIGNGDEFGRNAALRLINIWEERKVFGSRGQLLKEELVGRNLETSNRNRNPPGFKLRNSAGNGLDKVISAYQVVCGGQVDEDTVLSKCRNAIICIEKVGKEIDGDIRSEQLNGSGTVEEIKGQHAILLGCIQQLTFMESSRANLVSHLREALREQEFRLSHVRQQLQAAQSQSEKAGNLCRQFQNNSVQLLAEQHMKKTHTSKVPQSFMAGSGEQTAPLMCTRQVPNAVKPEPLEEYSKSGAAAVAAQLTSSTSSGQMPTYILASLATEGVIVSATKESSNDYPPEKKPKLENDHSVYIPSQNPQPPVPPFPHPGSLKPSVSITSKEIIPGGQPPLPTSPPPMPPLPPMHPYPVPQFMQNAGSIPSIPYGYATTQQQPQPSPYPNVGTQFTGISPFPAPPANSYQNYQTGGGFYGQQLSFSNAPISRQL